MPKFSSPYFFDGAFGTYFASLYGAGRCELANLSQPDAVRRIHRDYLAAGADAITANTFALNPSAVPDLGELARLISAGIALAKECAGTSADVYADIGPSPSDQPDDFLTSARLCLEAGAERFIFETQQTFEPLLPAIHYIKAAKPDAVVVVSFAVSQDGYTRGGLNVRRLLADAQASPFVDAAGINCVCGPAHMAELTAELAPRATKPFLAMPNSSYPTVESGRTVYNDNAEYFASKLADMFAHGAALLGGCCGTTPEHIAAALAAVRGRKRAEAKASGVEASAAPEPNRFAEKIRAGKRVLAAELDPPTDADFSGVLSAARAYAAAGTDVITVADSPLSRARADSFMTAAMLHAASGADVLPHLTCRDRNHIAMRAALLAASAMGVGSVLAVTGDPLADPFRGEQRGVFCMNSRQLISFIADLNRGPLARKPLLIAGALNVSARNFDAELRKAEDKLACGAELLFTQPVFTDAAAENLRRAHERLAAPILAGILPVASYKNALFLQNEVSGIEISPELLERLRPAAAEEVAEISSSFAAETALRVREHCSGYYIMTPLRRSDIVVRLIEILKETNCV